MDRRSFCPRFNSLTIRALTVYSASVLVALTATANTAVAADSVIEFSNSMPLLAAVAGGNAYLSWWKLALVVVTFVLWVRNADWINQDSVKIEDGTEIVPQFWNLMNVGLGIAGFFAAISIPIFWIGYPLLLMAALLPIICYTFVSPAGEKSISTPSS